MRRDCARWFLDGRHGELTWSMECLTDLRDWNNGPVHSSSNERLERRTLAASLTYISVNQCDERKMKCCMGNGAKGRCSMISAR